MSVVVWRRCFPAHTENEVSCRVGGVVEWRCVMCVHCRGVDALCLLWDGLRASGGLPGVS